MLRFSPGFQTLENNKNTRPTGLVVSNVSRVWNPDETLALVFEVLLKTIAYFSPKKIPDFYGTRTHGLRCDALPTEL